MKKILTAIVLSVSFLGSSAFAQAMVTMESCPVGNKCSYLVGPKSHEILMTQVIKGSIYNCHFDNMGYLRIQDLTGIPATIILTKTSSSDVVINAQNLSEPSGSGKIKIHNPRLEPKEISVQCTK